MKQLKAVPWFRCMAVLGAILASLTLAPDTYSATNRCTDTADKHLFKVKSWSGLRKWFESYPDCDDGYLSEGVSDYVAVSLGQRWSDLPRLQREMKRNSRFEAFVIQHIDPTDDSDDLAAIVENATQRCPIHSETLCASLAKAAREALKQIEEPDALERR
jgi:hypothetical protein